MLGRGGIKVSEDGSNRPYGKPDLGVVFRLQDPGPPIGVGQNCFNATVNATVHRIANVAPWGAMNARRIRNDPAASPRRRGGTLTMTSADYAYFLHVPTGSTSWNPFEGLGRRSAEQHR